ncbi:MAG: SNF2-related protein, partial [Armatimonadota bacterium]
MNNFITNEDTRDLKKRIIQLTKTSEELKFLVGFFYFSGIRELYEAIKSNPDLTIKVLVGLNIDKLNHSLIEVADNENLNDDEKTYKFFESVKSSLNNEQFDTQDFYEQISFFVSLISDGRLIIRKTDKPNHSKLYIFKLNEIQVKRSFFITGSSNFTSSGLSLQNEFNVEISDYGFEEAEEYFDRLWENAVEITEHDESKKKLIELIVDYTHIKNITPYDAYCLLLKTYLDTFSEKEIGESLITTLKNNQYNPYSYQLDAVKQALSIIESNNGVIIADVVGLGKTIIACAIGKQLKKRGLVICPPGLVGDRNRNSGWKRYIEEFGLCDWEVRSLGDLESTLEFVNKVKDIDVVIVDEAHRFRNQDTKDYELLKNICREKQVILLTATPFNNRPGDILSLLKLFITPKQSSITLESNLVWQFQTFKGVFDRLSYIKKYHNSSDNAKRKKAESHYKSLFEEEVIDLRKVASRAHFLARQVRNVIEPVTIRRNRLDLQNNPLYKQEVSALSKVTDPQEWFFELTADQSNFYTEIIEHYFASPDDNGRFKGAIYRPFEYEKEIVVDDADKKMNEEDNRQFQQQRNLYDFMRRLLVKRFESSFGSFHQSISNFKRINQTCLGFVEKTNEFILDRKLLEKIYELDDDEIEEHLVEYEKSLETKNFPKNHRRYKLDKFKYRQEFIDDIKSDIDMFEEILNRLSQLDLVDNDPKTLCLIEHINEELNKTPKEGEPKRKIIIFTEYVDTAKYLEKALNKAYSDRLLVVAGDLPPSKIEDINKNFD